MIFLHKRPLECVDYTPPVPAMQALLLSARKREP